MSKQGFVYILANENRTVFNAGVTSNLEKRIYEHREKVIQSFTNRYNVNKLVDYEACDNIEGAIIRKSK